jgi:hypothetical protein
MLEKKPSELILTTRTIEKSYVIKNKLQVEKEKENGIYKNGLCVILEILLRHYNDIQHQGKMWFFDSEKTALNGIIGLKKN